MNNRYTQLTCVLSNNLGGPVPDKDILNTIIEYADRGYVVVSMMEYADRIYIIFRNLGWKE